ncbi:hypothetical protein Tco_0585353 [Tanacetum coccineum]
MIVPTLSDLWAQAFTSQCHVTQGHPDWYVDSGATAHMTSSLSFSVYVSHSAPHSSNMRVFFGNGDALPVSYIGQYRDRETKQVIAQGHVKMALCASSYSLPYGNFVHFSRIRPPISDAPGSESRPTDTALIFETVVAVPLPTTAAEPFHELTQRLHHRFI